MRKSRGHVDDDDDAVAIHDDDDAAAAPLPKWQLKQGFEFEIVPHGTV